MFGLSGDAGVDVAPVSVRPVPDEVVGGSCTPAGLRPPLSFVSIAVFESNVSGDFLGPENSRPRPNDIIAAREKIPFSGCEKE